MRSDRSGALSGGEPVRGRGMDPLFMATVDATEEAVLNALLASPTVVGRGVTPVRDCPPKTSVDS